MERPLELFAIVGIMTLVAALLLQLDPASRRRQVVVGGAIGGTSALVVATQHTDIIPDGLELALAGVVLSAAILVGVLLRFRARK